MKTVANRASNIDAFTLQVVKSFCVELASGLKAYQLDTPVSILHETPKLLDVIQFGHRYPDDYNNHAYH